MFRKKEERKKRKETGFLAKTWHWHPTVYKWPQKRGGSIKNCQKFQNIIYDHVLEFGVKYSY